MRDVGTEILATAALSEWFDTRSSDISHNRAQLLMPALATTISNRPRRREWHLCAECFFRSSGWCGSSPGPQSRLGGGPTAKDRSSDQGSLDALLAGAVAAVTRVRLAAH